MYNEGNGVLQNYEEAAKLVLLAAKQGHHGAIYDLAIIYFKGKGVAQDYKEAAKWFMVVAKDGDAGAQYALGKMYRDGLGMPQDYIHAHKWLNIAGANNERLNGEPNPLTLSYNKKARKARDRIERKMTSAQIEKAQKLAREWVDNHTWIN